MALPLAAAFLLAATAEVAAQEAAPGRSLRRAGAAAGQGPPAPPAGAGALFAALDRDGDGALTLWEAQAGAGAAQELAAGLFGAADADGSGAVGPEEFGYMAGVLQRQQTRARTGRNWEEAMRLRATARRASAGHGGGEFDEAEVLPRLRATPESNQSVDEAVDGKNLWSWTETGKDPTPWNPDVGCEVYTDRPCGEHTQGNRTCHGVSTCKGNTCVCPDGYCASVHIGHCTKCDDWDADTGGPGNSSCVHNL